MQWSMCAAAAHHRYVLMLKVEWIQQQMVQKRVKRTETMDQTHDGSFNDPKWDSMWYIVSMQHTAFLHLVNDTLKLSANFYAGWGMLRCNVLMFMFHCKHTCWWYLIRIGSRLVVWPEWSPFRLSGLNYYEENKCNVLFYVQTELSNICIKLVTGLVVWLGLGVG